MQTLDGFNATSIKRLDVSDGGFLVGPGTDKSDDILARGPSGCFVLNAETVKIIGREKIGLLINRALAQQLDCYLSPGEYVVSPAAVVAIGAEFLEAINLTGDLLRDGDISPERAQEAKAAMIESIDDALAILERTLEANGLDVPRLAGGGMLGVSLGAATQQYGREREMDRQDEALNMRKEDHAQSLAMGALGLKDAKLKQDDNSRVREHFQQWREGRDKLAAGDYADVPDFLANHKPAKGFEGHTFAFQSTPDGDTINLIGADGNVRDSMAIDPQKAVGLYDRHMEQQLKFLSPGFYQAATNAAAKAAEGEANRKTRFDVADRAAGSREYSADTRADSNEEVAGIRAGATTDAADIHASATTKAAGIRAAAPRASAGARGLTAAQERSNAEIDAARGAVAGMSPQDIRTRTAKATNTGRDNPDYDPALARQAALSNRRKIGNDETFDGRQPQQAASTLAGQSLTAIPDDQLKRLEKPASPQAKAKIDAELTRRAFTSDPSMKGNTLGEATPQGYKVFDAQGRHVGHFQR